MAYLSFPLQDPVTDLPEEGAELTVGFRTLIAESRSGLEQRRPLWTTPRHRMKIGWKQDENSARRADLLWAFFCEARGACYPWAYAHHDASRTWAHVRFGPSDGLGAVYSLPCVGATVTSVYVGGSLVVGWSISAGNSSNDWRDVITLASTPAAGVSLDVTFTGRRWFLMRFQDDDMSYQAFTAKLYSTGINAIEVKGE